MLNQPENHANDKESTFDAAGNWQPIGAVASRVVSRILEPMMVVGSPMSAIQTGDAAALGETAVKPPDDGAHGTPSSEAG